MAALANEYAVYMGLVSIYTRSPFARGLEIVSMLRLSFVLLLILYGLPQKKMEKQCFLQLGGTREHTHLRLGFLRSRPCDEDLCK